MNRDAAHAAVGSDHKLHGHGALPSHAAGLARTFKRGENGLSHFTEKRIPVPAHDEKRGFGRSGSGRRRNSGGCRNGRRDFRRVRTAGTIGTFCLRPLFGRPAGHGHLPHGLDDLNGFGNGVGRRQGRLRFRFRFRLRLGFRLEFRLRGLLGFGFRRRLGLRFRLGHRSGFGGGGGGRRGALELCDGEHDALCADGGGCGREGRSPDGERQARDVERAGRGERRAGFTACLSRVFRRQ